MNIFVVAWCGKAGAEAYHYDVTITIETDLSREEFNITMSTFRLTDYSDIVCDAEDILQHLRNEHPGAKVDPAKPDFEIK